MSCCRTCGCNVNESEAMDIFAKINTTLIHHIELVTGVWLPNKLGFPVHLCTKCQLSLKQAIAFRESCIETQQYYLQRLEACRNDSSNEQRKFNSKQLKAEMDPLYISEDSWDVDMIEDLQCSQTISEQGSTYDIVFKSDMNSDLMSDSHTEPNIPSALDKTKISNNKTDNIIMKIDKTWATVDKKKAHGKKRKGITKSQICVCDICGKNFLCKRNLDLHQMRHTGVKNVPCEFCDAKFYTISLLNLHKRQHTNPFKCSYCDETFGYNSSRMRHERIHRDERPFKCRFCEKSFRCSTSKKGHEVTHTRVRSFECKVCGTWFLTNKHLKTHKRTKAHKQLDLIQGTQENGDSMAS